MPNAVFEYDDYRRYLADRLGTTGAARGTRSRLATALGCQTAFISQVLGGRAHFSFEHGIRISRFLEHSRDEAACFMTLLQLGRAGTAELRRYHAEQLEELRARRKSITARLQGKPALGHEAEAIYYGAWYHAAIHVLLSVPGFGDPAKIAQHLGLPLRQVQASLRFLEGAGLAVAEDGRYRIGNARIHIGRESPMRARHHANWRLRALQAMERESGEDLFFSSVYSLSEADVRRVRELLVATLERAEGVIVASPEEAVFCLAMDLFRI